MKKIFYSLIGIAILVACAKEQDQAQNNSNEQQEPQTTISKTTDNQNDGTFSLYIDKTEVKKFVENELTSKDSFELRKLIKERTPDIDLNFDFKCEQCNHDERIGVPLTVQFFWPDSGR